MLPEPFGQTAANDHALGVEDVHDIGDQNPQVVLSLRHHLAHDVVFFLERPHHDARGHALAVSSLHDLQHIALAARLDGGADVALHGRAAGQSFRAAAFSAGAARPVRLNDHVTDFSGASPVALVKPPARNDAPADSRSNKNPHELFRPPARAERVLANHAHVHVVFNQHGNLQGLTELGAERHVAPAEVRSGSAARGSPPPGPGAILSEGSLIQHASRNR